jgi:hypothetical protein
MFSSPSQWLSQCALSAAVSAVLIAADVAAVLSIALAFVI